MRRLAVAVLFVAAAVTAGVTSCNQGEGDRCQRQSDCSGDLICNQATGTCQTTTGGVDGQISPDARVLFDADTTDADTTDADTTDADPAPDAEP